MVWQATEMQKAAQNWPELAQNASRQAHRERTTFMTPKGRELDVSIEYHRTYWQTKSSVNGVYITYLRHFLRRTSAE